MKINYAIFYTENLERITHFYENILGLELFSFKEEKFVSFKLGNGLFGIKKKVEEREIPGYQSVIISVENIQELYNSYQKKDLIWYKRLTNQEWGVNFAILDPDGNKFEIVQEKKSE